MSTAAPKGLWANIHAKQERIKHESTSPVSNRGKQRFHCSSWNATTAPISIARSAPGAPYTAFQRQPVAGRAPWARPVIFFPGD